MARRIMVLRHGETLFNAQQKLQGHCNSALTDRGIAQAKSVGLRLAQHLTGRPYRVYASDLGRAMQTAAIVCAELNYPADEIVPEPRVREFSLGRWEQCTIPELLAAQPDLLERRDWYLQAPGSESCDAVRTRLHNWLASLPEEQDVVVVSHGLTGIVLRGMLLGLDDEATWQQDLPQDAFFIIEAGSMTRVDCKPTPALA
ncbi:histidine phosphatase family protein [Aeromonas taiwanensis]|uniref:histidine phosphatase family protein n=1 Tax=Aeromonas taiwanensis TaxID=633417 RepID=UPI00248F08B1|nr:histidine phosphatase family protein [Aeromonas taiwanensis]